MYLEGVKERVAKTKRIKEWPQCCQKSPPVTLHQTTKMSALCKLKGFADDKLNVSQSIEFVFFKIGNIVGKG